NNEVIFVFFNLMNLLMKSVAAQQNVTLTCPRTFPHKANLFWIRIISGHQPEFLGGTYGFDYEGVHQTRHFTTKQEPGTFILYINQSQISDTGLYYCIGTETLEMTFVRGVFLKVKKSVSLQCSVLSDSEKKTCSEDYRVHWFRAGSHQSHPDFIYTHGGNAECGNSSQKCFYSFSKKVSVSDAGTYYCAVAACGEVMFGNGAKLDIKDSRSTCSEGEEACSGERLHKNFALGFQFKQGHKHTHTHTPTRTHTHTHRGTCSHTNTVGAVSTNEILNSCPIHHH
uniref:Ig-like domain-containing protein n=1 Tax=Salarias fasciatus TaxID=181472 RepID=A0A672IN49_SALFA